MQKSRLTVYYNGALWVGVYERISDGRLEVCKILFGAEPKDYEVCQFLLQNWTKLRFSPSVDIEKKTESRINPKRMQRMVKKQLESNGIGTKSQQALKLQQEQIKTDRKTVSREKKEAEARRRFELKQQKKKEKHRGR